MRKAIETFVAAIILGIVGLFIGVSLDDNGSLGIIIAIATVGAFIVYSIEENRKK